MPPKSDIIEGITKKPMPPKKSKQGRVNPTLESLVIILCQNGIIPRDEREEITKVVLAELPGSTVQKMHDLYISHQLSALSIKTK